MQEGSRVRVNSVSSDKTKIGMTGSVVWVQGGGIHAGVWVDLDRKDIGGRFFAAEELDHE